MYLSCYTLDLRESIVRKALQNAHQMHRCVMSAYRTIDSGQSRRDMSVLYRLQSTGQTQKLYVSSLDLPIYDMPAGFNKEPNSPKDISKTLEYFQNGMILDFDIMAMPAKKVRVEGSKNSKRIYLGLPEYREKWLLDKANQNGFKVLSFTEQNSTDNKIKSGGFKSIVFKGTLRITDVTKFIKAYQHGIGAEKAFGCGMLLVYKTL